MKVLAVQNNAIINNKKANFINIEKLLKPFHDLDLIVLSEVFACGWSCKDFEKFAETEDESPTLDFLKETALEHKAMVIGGSFIRKDQSGNLKNTCPVISKNGKLLALYDKMHLFSHKGSEENKYITSGNELVMLNLKDTKIGLSVCYDIRFPELFRAYSNAGAEILISTAAWGKNKLMHWEIMQKARAIENQCYMIAADQTGPITKNEYNLGHSMIINPWGEVLAQLGEEEGCIYADLDLEKLRKLRNEFPLLKDRRNDTFKIREINVYE